MYYNRWQTLAEPHKTGAFSQLLFYLTSLARPKSSKIRETVQGDFILGTQARTPTGYPVTSDTTVEKGLIGLGSNTQERILDIVVSGVAMLEEGMACLLQGTPYTGYRWHN